MGKKPFRVSQSAGHVPPVPAIRPVSVYIRTGHNKYPRTYFGRVDLFLTRGSILGADDRRLCWRTLAARSPEVHEICGNHAEIVGANETPKDEAAMKDLARRLRAIIDNELGYG